MHLQLRLCIALFLASAALGAVSGTMLKCGEDIIVGRGERKTLKFWSAEDNLLKVQLVSPSEVHSRRPPGGVTSYSKIPGLSEAILAHTKSKLGPGGLHYAGNPDIEISHLLENQESSFYDDDDYYTFSNQNETDDSHLVGVSDSESLPDESGEKFSTTELISDFVDSAALEELQTTTVVRLPSTTTQSSTTTLGMKLVTFFPDLQNYTRGETKIEEALTTQTISTTAPDANSNTNERIEEDSSENAANNAAQTDLEVRDSLAANEEGNLDESQPSVDDEVHQDLGLSNETESEHNVDVQSSITDTTEDPLVDSLLAILNGNIKAPGEKTSDDISGSDASDAELRVGESSSEAADLSSELNLASVGESSQAEESDAHQHKVHTKLDDEEVTVGEEPGFDSQYDNEGLPILNLAYDDDISPSQNDSGGLEISAARVPATSDGETNAEGNEIGSSVDIESSDIEENLRNTQQSTTYVSLDAESTTMSSFSIDDNLMTESSGPEHSSTDKSDSEVREAENVNELAGIKYDTDSKDTVYIDSPITGAGDYGNEYRAGDETEGTDGIEESVFNDSTNAVSAPSELPSQFVPMEEDKSAVTSAAGELTTASPDQVSIDNADNVATTEQQTHKMEDLGTTVVDGSSTESPLDHTTTLDELLRESFSDILAEMNTENATIEQSAKEAPDHEISDDQLASVDSIDEMEKLMSTLADGTAFSQPPPLGPETGYHNIKHVSMAGHQNNFDNAVVDNHEYLLRQEDILLDENIENSSPFPSPLANSGEGIAPSSWDATSSGNNNENATRNEEMNPTQEESLSSVDESSKNELAFEAERNTSATELRGNISESLAEDTSQSHSVMDSNHVEISTETEELSFAEEEVISTTSLPMNESPESVPKSAGNGTGPLVEDDETNEVLGIAVQTTTENELDSTEATSQVPDGFKGYDYYENLYDSLMPQQQTEGMIGIDDLLAQSGDALELSPEAANLEDFDTDVLPEVDYDATKASIPKTSIDDGSQPLDATDIEQARVPSPAWEPSDNEPPTFIHGPNDVEDSLTGEIEGYEEGIESLSLEESPKFDAGTDEQAIEDLPIGTITSDVTDGMEDIYQMRVKGPSLETLRDNLKLNSAIDVDPSHDPILSQEIPYQKHDGREKVQNDILNSIASIIKDTLDSSDGNTEVATESILSTDATTKIPDTEQLDDVSIVSNNAEERTKEDSNASELIEIPLEIINGEIKVSQRQPTSSLSVPLSALESEESFDNYLKNNLVYGSHVLVLDNGDQVAVQSFDELTTALKSDQANGDSVPRGSESDQSEVAEEQSAISGQSNTELPQPEGVDEVQDGAIASQSNFTMDATTDDGDFTAQTQKENFERDDGGKESQSATEDTVEDLVTTDAPEERNRTDLHLLVSHDDASETLKSEAGDDSAAAENNEVKGISDNDVETSTANTEAVEAGLVEENSPEVTSPKASESTNSSKNVIDILEDMLFSDLNLDKLITEEKAERSGNESEAELDESETVLDESSESERDETGNYNNEIRKAVLVSEQEVSAEESENLNYSNDFDLSSLRVAENEHEKSPQDDRHQWQTRKPARKDDSGFEFGGDTPFLMRLPGSPNPGLVYIQYEPVQVKYVPVEGQDPGLNTEEDEDERQFSKRTGIEHELNAIETDVLLNNTAASSPASHSAAQREKVQAPEGTDASKGIYQMIGNVIPHFDYDVDPNPNFEVQSSTENTHAHINIPLSFISQEPAYEEVPDPFVVMPPPDLTSQELVSPDDPAQSMYSHVIEPHAEYQSGNLDPLILEREKADENFISGGEVAVRKQDEDMLEPGKYYSSEHRGTIYGDVDLERLNNPVFKLQTKLHRPTADELMNPSFTPFPITTNPPREIFTTQASHQVSISPSEIAQEINEIGKEINVIGNSSNFSEANASSVEHVSPSAAALLISKDDASANEIFSDSSAASMENSVQTDGASFKEPESVGFSSPPAVDFRLSYNPSDMPKFMRENPNAFPSWYPRGNDDNSFRAEALTAEESTPLGSHREATLEISGKNFADFDKFDSNLKESARHSGNAFLRESRWPSNDNHEYGAFYHPADIPGVMMADLTRRHLSLPGDSQESRSSGLPWYKSHSNPADEIEGGSAFENDPSAPLIFGPKFFKYLNSLPVPLLRDFLEPSPSERAVRMRRSAEGPGDQVYCEWNIKTEPGLFLLMHFQNLSAPYSVDCHGAYIEVERENNGYDARYCGNRVAHMGNRPHVIFAKSEVRITVYDDGGAGKSKPTGFDAEIDVIDLFNPNEYSAFMESESYPHIRRLLNG